MVDNVIAPPLLPGEGSQNLNQHMAEFNKTIGLGSEQFQPPINPNKYNPTPTAAEIYQKVVGSPMTGSNPGLKTPQINLSAELANLNAHGEALVQQADKQIRAGADVNQMMRPFSYNGDYDGANFQRYYNSAPFKKLGFNPYRDNESLYNDKMTTGDEFVRAAGQWPSLIKTGVMSGIRAWGNLFTDPLSPDLKSSREMARSMAVGSATKPGVGSFLINTALNSGYTLGIGAEMLGESLLLGGAISAVSKLDELKTFGTAAKAVIEPSEKVKDFNKLTESVPALENFWNTHVVGKTISGIASTLNPLEHTFALGKDIASGENIARYTDETLGTVKKFAQFSNNFGEFAKDLIQTKSAMSEAQLEGGTVQIDTTTQLIQEYRNKHNGDEPVGEELARIERIANEEARRTALWNYPAISWSNKFMYQTLFAPFEPIIKTTAESIAKEGLVEGAKGLELAEEGVAGEVAKFKNAIKSPKAWGEFGYNYLKENAAEGVQENLQDAISSGAEAHAKALYNNPDKASYEGYMGHFMTGLKGQFSAAGAETFAGGFIMSMFAHPFMSGPMFLGQQAWNNTIGKEKYEKYKADRKAQLTKIADTVNEVYNTPQAYFAPDAANAVKQGNLQEDLYHANVAGNRKGHEDIKNTALNEHLYTALATDKFDFVLDQFKKMNTLSPQAAADAFLGAGHTEEEGTKVLDMMDKFVERANNIKKNYDEVSAGHPNPYNPARFAVGTIEHIAQSISHTSWEEAKKSLIFAKTEFNSHQERIKQLADVLVGRRNPIKDVNAQDLLVLMDKNHMDETILSLHNDIKSSDLTTKEGRKIIKEKERRIELLSTLSEKFEYLSKPETELTAKERKAQSKKLKTVFKNYINHVSGTKGALVFDDELNHALELIKDNHTLKDERASLVKSINVLNNPKGFLNLQRKLAPVFKDMFDARVEEVTKRVKRFADIDQQSKANSMLFKEAGVYLTPEYSLYLEKAMAGNEVIELPKSFVDGKDTLKNITDPTDPIFIKASEVFDKIVKGIQADEPVVPISKAEEPIKNGQLIYATMGSGKSTAVKEAGKKGNLVDADDLLVAEIKRVNAQHEGRKDVPAGESPQNTIYNYAKNVPKAELDQLYETIRGQIKDLKNKGKIILTGSARLIKDADRVYTIQDKDEAKIGLEGDDLAIFRERERSSIKEAGKEAIPLEGYIGEKFKGLPKVLTEVETKHNLFVGDLANKIKNRRADIDALIKKIDDSGVTVEENIPDADIEDGSPFMEEQRIADEKFRERLATHDKLKDVTANPTGGQLEAIDNLKRTGFLTEAEVGPTDEITDLGSASWDITKAVRRIQWMKAKAEKSGTDEGMEEIGKLEDYLDDIRKLQSEGDRLAILKDTYNLIINKDNEALDKHADALDRAINKYQAEVNKAKGSDKWYQVEKGKLYQSSLDALKNARELVTEQEEEQKVEIKQPAIVAVEPGLAEDINTLKNRLQDLMMEKEKYETSADIREGTPEIFIADKWRRIDTKSAVTETGLKVKTKSGGDISPSLLSSDKGITVDAAAEYFIQDHADKIGNLDMSQVKDIIIDILNAGSITAYRSGRINTTGVQAINREIKEITMKLDELQVEANLKPNYEILGKVEAGKQKGKSVQYHNLPEGVPVEYFVYKAGKGKFYVSGFTRLSILAPIGQGETEEDAINNAFETLTDRGKEPVKEETEKKPTLDQRVSTINDVKTFNEYDKVREDAFKTVTTIEDDEVITETLQQKLQDLMTDKKFLTPENLSQAKKKGYKVVVNGQIYSNFTVNKKNKTVSIKSPLGTGSQKYNISQIEEITMRNAEAPIAISTETKGQAKEIMSTGSEVVSSDDLQKANDEAKTQSNETINDDFFNNLGCK